MTDAFYVPDGELFVSTQWTRGPWDERAQHAGPPAALLARAIELLEPGWQVGRFTFEILRSIPVAPLRVEARVARPGRRVQMCEGSLRAGDDEVARATAWRVKIAGEPAPTTDDEPPPFAGPADSSEVPMRHFGEQSYFTAMEWRYARGSFDEKGPATCWFRMRHPLVAGEENSALSRVLAAADSGNGISHAVDIATHLFINTELTVHLFHVPEGEWVCLDAATRMAPSGTGLASSVIYDERRRIGSGNQTLLVSKR